MSKGIVILNTAERGIEGPTPRSYSDVYSHQAHNSRAPVMTAMIPTLIIASVEIHNRKINHQVSRGQPSEQRVAGTTRLAAPLALQSLLTWRDDASGRGTHAPTFVRKRKGRIIRIASRQQKSMRTMDLDFQGYTLQSIR